MDKLTETVVYTLDLFGTAAFAFSGALRVVDRRPDFVGMLILAGVTAVGGGMFRDVVLNRDSVVALDDIGYPIAIFLSVTVTFFFPTSLFRHRALFKYFDAVGLGVFSAFTASVAWQMGYNPLAILLLATFSGCAGGVVRDLIVQKPSIVLETDLYVTPVIVGAMGLMIMSFCGAGELLSLVTAFLVTTGLRLASIIWDIRMPRLLEVTTSTATTPGATTSVTVTSAKTSVTAFPLPSESDEDTIDGVL